ncbi:ROK family protein, partial [bacterium]|nr:ROK family protein [bacterium]
MTKYIASIDLGGTHLRTALFSTDGKIVTQSKIKTEGNSGVNGVLKRIKSAVLDSVATLSILPSDVVALGIGVPGPVDSARGLVYNCPNMPGWHNIFVKKELEELLGVPVFVENDARVAALGELYFGAGHNVNHFFYVTIGTGIGGAIIIDGKLYRGADGAAGEFGMTRTLGGDIFEGYASGPAIYQKFGILP